MPPASNSAAVIVVGAGPVGLTLANLLGESGIDVLVLEAETEQATDLRASTFHPPTLEMLERLGVTQSLIDQGMICPDWQLRWHPRGERAVFDMSVLADETRYPYRLQCEQWKLSKLLLAQALARKNVQIKFDYRATAVTQGDDGVVVEAEHAGNVEQFRAKYAVGCDGVRSMVRKSAGLALGGKTYPEIGRAHV